MSELFLLYLWTRLDAIHHMLGSVFLMALVAAVVFAIAGSVLRTDNDEDTPEYATGVRAHTYALRLVVLLLVLEVVSVVVPTEKDAAIIAGGWLVKEAAQSEVAKNIGEKTYRLIQGKLDEAIEEMEKKVNK